MPDSPKLTQINIYPVKSMAGISVNTAIVEERGFRFDRRWMLINEENQHLSQREFKHLAKAIPSLHSDCLKVHWNQENIELSLEDNWYPERSIVKVFGTAFEALIASEQVNKWFSKQLGAPCKLAYQGTTQNRLTSGSSAPKVAVSMADGYPYLMVSEASLSDLNLKLKHPVSMNRFRPNLVVSGLNAFEEENYSSFQIGTVKFRGVKPCARCIITTINQSTLERGTEPLRTLSTYRKEGNKINFGQNLQLNEGFNESIQVGMEVVKGIEID